MRHNRIPYFAFTLIFSLLTPQVHSGAPEAESELKVIELNWDLDQVISVIGAFEEKYGKPSSSDYNLMLLSSDLSHPSITFGKGGWSINVEPDKIVCIWITSARLLELELFKSAEGVYLKSWKEISFDLSQDF